MIFFSLKKSQINFMRYFLKYYISTYKYQIWQHLIPVFRLQIEWMPWMDTQIQMVILYWKGGIEL